MKALNSEFIPIAEVDIYESLILHLKYYKCGSFELYSNMVIPGLAYCYMDEFPGNNVGIVESISIGNGVTYSGRLLKQLLSNKVIHKTKTFYKKTPEQIAKALVAEFALQDIVIEEDKGLGTQITIQVTGENLLEFCDKILETQDLGCEVIYDYVTNEKVFRVFKGADNTQYAPLSTNFENIAEYQYKSDRSSFKNYAYVAGEVQEGQPRAMVEVDMRKGNEEKRELWVDARDLQSEVENDNGEMERVSQEEYENMLYQRGAEKLLEYNSEESCVISPKIDLSIGELRCFKDDETGIESEQRVVELIYAKEGNSIKQDIVWGKQNIRRSANV